MELGKGRVELKDLLLNAEAINRDLCLDGWEVKAGYIGSASALLPLPGGAAVQPSLSLQDLCITLVPAQRPAPGSPDTADSRSSVCASAAAQEATSAGSAAEAWGGGSSAAGDAAASAAAAAGGGAGAFGFLFPDDSGRGGQGSVMESIRSMTGSLQASMRAPSSAAQLLAPRPHMRSACSPAPRLADRSPTPRSLISPVWPRARRRWPSPCGCPPATCCCA